MVHILFSDLVLKHGCSLANVEHVVVSAMSEFCHHKTTPVGFEPTRGDPIGLAGRRLNRSAKVSLASQGCFILKPNETAHAHFTLSTTSNKRIGADLLIA